METVVTLLSLLCVSGALAQCRTDPGLSITAPPQMEALSGSCLLIPCNFSSKPKPGDQFISTRTIYGVWIKSDYRFGKYPDNVVYNGSLTDNIYPMNIRGNLSQTNCTTLFSNLTTAYTDSYYFRVENGPYKATASCDPLQINVTDSPQTPLITITQRDLKENQSVTISCSAPTPCPLSPPKLTWSLQQDPHNNMEENPDGTFTTQIQETITLSDQHDGSNISCSATYPVNGGHNNKTAETQVTLSVSCGKPNPWAAIFGGIIGFIVVICLVVTVWCLKFKHPSAHHTQSPKGKDLAVFKTPRPAEETIHYGEIDLSRLRPELSVTIGQQQQDTVYAQVKVSQSADPDNLYAHVKT